MIEPAVIISMAVGIMLGHYSIFYLLVEKNFVTRYKKFYDDFDTWVKDENEEFYNKLQSKIDERPNPQDFFDFVAEWGKRYIVIDDFIKKRDKISNLIKYIFLFLFGSIILSFFGILNPERINPGAKSPLYFTSLAWISLFGAIIIVTFFLYLVYGLNEFITKYELAKSIKEYIENEIEKAVSRM